MDEFPLRVSEELIKSNIDLLEQSNHEVPYEETLGSQSKFTFIKSARKSSYNVSTIPND